MYVIEVSGKYSGEQLGFMSPTGGITPDSVTARKYALPADAIPYAEELSVKHGLLGFSVVPYVEA